MELRKYQSQCIDDTYAWFEQNKGNPCIVLPTGAGKSVVIAAFCQRAITDFPKTRIIIATHQKELIEQDEDKLLKVWPSAPCGVYSASVKRKELGNAITFVGIQTGIKNVQAFGSVDLLIIDEAHLVSHKDEGSYRKFITALSIINPYLKVIGLTATPYRLGHGLITSGTALFTEPLIEPVSIIELQKQGYLARLISKRTDMTINTDGVGIRGGEYIESELQRVVNTYHSNTSVVNEVISQASDRKSWLFFCSGISHAENVKALLRERGVTCECVTGNTPKKEREDILRRFANKEIQALTNANILTTGFDYPDLDLIVLMRPTMSPGLYMQMVGRGLRLKSHTDNCLVLDFAGVVQKHGPITNVTPPKAKGKGDGVAPCKICPECDEIIAAITKTCPECGHEFPFEEKEQVFQLYEGDIMGNEPNRMDVSSWQWCVQLSKKDKIPMLRCVYYGYLGDIPISEYYLLKHDGYTADLARKRLATVRCHSKLPIFMGTQPETMEEFAKRMTEQGKPPTYVTWRKNNQGYPEITSKKWEIKGDTNE